MVIGQYEIYVCDGVEMAVVSNTIENGKYDIILLMKMNDMNAIYHRKKSEIGQYVRDCTGAEIEQFNRACNNILGGMEEVE